MRVWISKFCLRGQSLWALLGLSWNRGFSENFEKQLFSRESNLHITSHASSLHFWYHRMRSYIIKKKSYFLLFWFYKSECKHLVFDLVGPQLLRVGMCQLKYEICLSKPLVCPFCLDMCSSCMSWRLSLQISQKNSWSTFRSFCHVGAWAALPYVLTTKFILIALESPCHLFYSSE